MLTRGAKMKQKGSITPGALFKRKGGSTWYFKFTDHTGKRIQRSTGTTDKKEAAEIQRKTIELHGRNRPLYAEAITLKEAIAPFTDVKTNPRYKEALINGTNYTAQYAHNFARYSKYLIDIIDKHIPGLLDSQLSLITKRDLKEVAAAIVKERGNTRTSQQVFSSCKTILKQASLDDYIITSPGEGLPDIGYEEKPLIAIDEDLLSWMISQEQLFPSVEFWAYITVVASTGMRRGEALAISKEKMVENLLTIDQQIKSNTGELSKPKGGLIRTIPLPEIAMKALAKIEPKDSPFYFPLTKNWTTTQFQMLKVALKISDQKHKNIWDQMTIHTLRRSLNTNLLIHGASSHLVAEYLSWKHQSQRSDSSIIMQRRYLKLGASDLQQIADLIDKLYTYEEGKQTKVIRFNA